MRIAEEGAAAGGPRKAKVALPAYEASSPLVGEENLPGYTSYPPGVEESLAEEAVTLSGYNSRAAMEASTSCIRTRIWTRTLTCCR